MVNGIEEYEFQNNCVESLFNLSTDPTTKQVITVKAPTGAGKTVILVKYIDFYLKNTNGQTAFIWLCPGTGDLEEQSKDRMDSMTPHIDTRALMYSLLTGFDGGSVTFVNWELVTKRKNNALKDSERKNLYDRIAEAHSSGITFIVIVDEEHRNDTSKANDIIEAFAPKNIIRVSATPQDVKHNEFIEIPEDDVINAGLITKAIYVNEYVNENTKIENDYEYLLDLADAKRIELHEAYKMVGSDVRPLVLIQFPAGHPETIQAVEKKLESMGYTYGNKMVNIWMSDEKIKNDDLTANNGQPAFLLMKQAVSTGWDCPRAKILVKLREGGSEKFQIQTIGRIRRMPERKHYDFPGILDLCYIYTLDSEYKQGLLTTMDKAYQVRRLFAKQDVREFTLTKEMRNLDVDSGLSERELIEKVFDHFRKKYGLTSKSEDNTLLLQAKGYNFSHEIDSKIAQGLFRSGEDLANVSNAKRITVQTKINTHTHGIYLVHAVDGIKTITSIPAARVTKILQRLFKKGNKKKRNRSKFKLLSLETSDFYAFVINNADFLRQEFREIMANQEMQMELLVREDFGLEAKTTAFKIPEMEFYKFSETKDVVLMKKNVYKDYTSEFVTSEARKSVSERLFEFFCEDFDEIEWLYKNGDSGQQYFSIVYRDGLERQCLFYPDYIVKMRSGDIWIIETKGGEQSGHTKNIDIRSEMKFNALKKYAIKYDLKWGFVRDIDEKLYINNTDYSEDMSGDNWQPLESILK